LHFLLISAIFALELPVWQVAFMIHSKSNLWILRTFLAFLLIFLQSHARGVRTLRESNGQHLLVQETPFSLTPNPRHKDSRSSDAPAEIDRLATADLGNPPNVPLLPDISASRPGRPSLQLSFCLPSPLKLPLNFIKQDVVTLRGSGGIVMRLCDMNLRSI